MLESLPLESASLWEKEEDGSFVEFAVRAAVLEAGSLGSSGGEVCESLCWVVADVPPRPGDRLVLRERCFDLAEVRVFRNLDGRVVAYRCTPAMERG